MIEFSLDGKNVTVLMSLYKNRRLESWYNYHITKHVIGDFYDESYYPLIGLSERERKEIRDIQLNDYYCGQVRENNHTKFCYSCNYVNSCSETLMDVKENYIDFIKSSLNDDELKPRHAHTLKKLKTKEELIVLNQNGVSIILQEKADRYHVKTTYRLTNINRFKIKEKYSIMDDDEICLEESKMIWRRRFRNPQYSNVNEHQITNWDPLEY